jgi:ankyrin repeat protein
MRALSFDGMSDRLMEITPAYAETCSWILDRPEYLRWRDPDQRFSHHGVFWIKGKAGTGKSTLMGCLHHHDCQQDRDGIIVSFFFNARSPDTLVKSTEGMYRCLLYQILTKLPRLKGELLHFQVPRPKEEAWATERLEKALRIIVLGLAADERITCYIDALDECKTKEVRRAIGRFEDLAESVITKSIGFRICFSSRYYPQITMRHHEEIQLDLLPEHMQDISRYIDGKLIVPQRAKLNLSRKIFDRCSGIFLWVVLVVKELREKSDSGSTHSKLLSILDSIPAELEDLFANVVAESDNALISIVHWKLFSTRMLTTRELYFAVQTIINDTATACWDSDEIDDDGVLRYLLHASRGLMELSYIQSGEQIPATEALEPYPRRELIFIHESVREYFLSSGLASMERISPHTIHALGHAKMAKGCLSYLELAFDHPALSKLSDSSSVTEWEHVMVELPFLEYAFQNVLIHTEIALTCGAVDFDVLERFPLQNVIMLMNKARSDTPALEHEHSSSLFCLLLDQERFELAVTLLARTSQLRHSSTLAQSIKICTPLTQTRLAKMDLREGCNSSRHCPLHLAIGRGLKNFAELLLDYGADVDMEEGPCISPICLAVAADDYDFLQLLFRYGARINTAKTKNILHIAVGQGARNENEIVQYLLERGVDANVVDDSSQTALHLTTGWRSADAVSIAEMLIKAGADIEAADKDGNTVLIKAAGAELVLLVMLLLRKGANVHARGHNHATALHAAVGRYINVTNMSDYQNHILVRVLLDAGADINADRPPHGTVLATACAHQNYQLARFLVERGAVLDPQHRSYADWLDDDDFAERSVGVYHLRDSESTISDNWSIDVQPDKVDSMDENGLSMF